MPIPVEGNVKVQPRVEKPDELGPEKEAVVTAEIKGLVFLEKEDQVKADGAPGLTGVVTGIQLLKSEEFQQKLQPYFGRPATLSVLDKICRDVIDYYRQEGFPVVNVVVPRQTVRDGVVQFVVTEAKVGKVIVEGAKWFNPDKFKDEVSLREGDPVDGDQLQEDVRWLNTNPFRSTDLAFQPGEAPGTTDVILEVNDRIPLRFFFTYDNYGIDLTGKNRQSLGFNLGNLFSLDQQAGFQYTTSWKDLFSAMNAYSGSYLIPLPWRNTLTVFGSYTDSQATTAPNQSFEGDSWQMSGRYNVPLPTLDPVSHAFYAGLDFKQSSNAFLIFGQNIATGAGSGLAPFSIFQLTAGYNANVPDELGLTSFELGGFYSPGGVTGWNKTPQFQQVVPNSCASYVYGKFNLDQQAGFQYTTSWKDLFTAMNAYSGSYLIPFPWRNTLTIFGSYTDSQSALSPGNTLQGDSWQISGRYNVPLPTLDPISHGFYA